jgi:maltose alpha-D-glucosyltransferase/alpha-amylase
VFPDKEKSLWQYDETTGQYYQHRFYKQQPDLNVANPAVRDEIARIMGFWMELGLSGFRVDAVPFLLETGPDDAAALPDPHDYLADLRAFLTRRNGEAVLLGEVNLPYQDTLPFFGDPQGVGDELTMCFDFVGMQQFYLSMARGSAAPLAQALRDRPSPPRDGHWATFVRNHDELTLDKLDDDQRQEVFSAFGPEERMRLYNRGLRRRLPPMLGGDIERIKLAYSVLFSLPGTPVLFYGEEIGMGENLDAEGRFAVRTPMQWTSQPDGGFSTADPSRFAAPMAEGDFGPRHVNVAGQREDTESLLSWIRLLIERYRESPELAWGQYEVIDTGEDAVLAHRCSVDDQTVFALHNFGEMEVEVELVDVGGSYELHDLLTDGTTRASGDGHATIALGRYGCRWLRAHPAQT